MDRIWKEEMSIEDFREAKQWHLEIVEEEKRLRGTVFKLADISEIDVGTEDEGEELRMAVEEVETGRLKRKAGEVEADSSTSGGFFRIDLNSIA